MLTGILKFNSGQIKLNGFDLALSSNNVKKLFGLVPQEIALYPTLSVKENLNYFGSMYGLKGEELKRRIDENLEIFQIAPHRSKKISQCSGGIKRRVNLAVGLIHQPMLLFLDEPTVGVDATGRT